MSEKKEQCCELDTDHDGDCPVHRPEKAMHKPKTDEGPGINPRKIDTRRIEVLSEMAQVQRRNAEMAMTLYTWTGGKKGDPSFPGTLRDAAKTKIENAFANLGGIDEELLKLL